MKQCFRCKIYKSKREFYKNKANKDGLYSYCKSCHVIATKKWKKENKELHLFYRRKRYNKNREFFAAYKKELKCYKCKENHPACLAFHHRNPSKKSFNIGCSLVRYSIKKIMKEIAKCDVLCANCHMKLHYDLKKK